ncbi:baculoviral IAP repeat-containing protein 2-like [Biomphalaria glabrata]|uniref:Baculoviral IAP repeat-containing protein 2-like n=1 Tax=Biomphalaria glabrata TaxID=6526 RepID=A0A9W3A4Q8_BIOGL|nr:baculoviral IAP repeat-containing protein 2-like [Biomphalaria glabrata]
MGLTFKFTFQGYGDCARCFYCGGGLRNWEDEDDVWVEHARWFPKCAYIRQQMGQVFVDTIQELNKTYDHIPFTMVKEKMGDAVSAFQLDTKDTPLKRDPAVKTVVDMGFPYVEVIAAAEAIKNDGNILSADKIFDRLVSDNINRRPNAPKIMELKLDGVNTETLARDTERLRSLKEQNNQLRQQTVCKICMDKEVAVVFLPCGHLVSCTDCAAAMKDCPVCRNHVRGIVRAFMG